MFDLEGVGLVDIYLFPVQYHPAAKKIEQFTSFSFVMSCEDGYQPGDFLRSHLPDNRIKHAETSLKSQVVNPEDVVVTRFEYSEFERKYVPIPTDLERP